MGTTTYNYELVIVDDGSIDGSRLLLQDAAAADPRIKVLYFSRNFGHQAAITAGLDFAGGDAVAVIDADLQDPPELLPQMVKLMEQDYDVVSAQRVSRKSDGFLKRATAKLFYWMMHRMIDERMIPEVGDFRLFSRRAILAIRQLREQHRFMRGMVAWLGLREAILPYDRNARVAGTTKYSPLKMLKLAWVAVASFSALPLRMAVFLGLFLTAAGLAFAGFSLFATFGLKATVPGWTSLVCLQVIFSGATLAAIGLTGDYIARIYEETKGRPLYVITDSANLRTIAPDAPANGLILPPAPEQLARDVVAELSNERSARKAHRV
jgi:dolichol-phosphate mannosyltransferase